MEIWPTLSKLAELADLIADKIVSTSRLPQLDEGLANRRDFSIEQALAAMPPPTRRGCRPRPLPPDALADAIRRYETGETLKDIAADHGFSRGFLANQLRAAGVTIHNHAMSEEEIREAAYLYGTGEPLVAIGTKLGYHHKTVWLALREANVPMRKPQERPRSTKRLSSTRNQQAQ